MSLPDGGSAVSEKFPSKSIRIQITFAPFHGGVVGTNVFQHKSSRLNWLVNNVWIVLYTFKGICQQSLKIFLDILLL